MTTVSEPGTAPWRRAEASRLIEFGRAAALADGGFGWLGANGEIDVTQPRPLYVNAGIGTYRIPVRWDCRPEITVVTI